MKKTNNLIFTFFGIVLMAILVCATTSITDSQISTESLLISSRINASNASVTHTFSGNMTLEGAVNLTNNTLYGVGSLQTQTMTIASSSIISNLNASYSNESYDLTCTDCIGTKEINDSYVLNTGDIVSGDLNITGQTFSGNSTGYMEVEADGTLVMHGTATVWDDIRVPLSLAKRLGFSDPDWVKFTGDAPGVFELAFDKDTDEEVFFSVQVPHDWKLGSDLRPHIHWSPSTTGGGSVTWKLEYTIAATGDVFGNTTYVNVTTAAGGIAKKSQYADMPDIDMSSFNAATDLSVMLICRVYRDVSDGDDYAADAFLHEIDFHYEMDTIGSRDETAK